MTAPLTLTSPEFAEGASIPPRYTCDGEAINPPLQIQGVPERAKALVLIVDDPDVPRALRPSGVFDHWVLVNIPPTTTSIAPGSVPAGALQGCNSAGKSAYAGPCPPPQYEPSEHRYVFHLYALDTVLEVKAGVTKNDTLRAMEGHVIGEAQLVGRYKRI